MDKYSLEEMRKEFEMQSKGVGGEWGFQTSIALKSMAEELIECKKMLAELQRFREWTEWKEKVEGEGSAGR